MIRDRALYRGGGGLMARFHIRATTIAGALLIRNAEATDAAEADDPTTTAAVAALGVALEAVTYSATQADFNGFPPYRTSMEEGTVGILFDPFQVLKMRVAGGATAGTALATGTPANILSNDTADATGLTITDTAVGTIDMDGGLICGRTGNNAGVVRRNTTHTDNVSDAVIVPFPRTIAVNDTFIRVPYSKSAQNVQLTDVTFIEADGTIAYGTGIRLSVTDVDFDIINSEVVIYGVLGSHQLNALA